jgi:hypothetical protein
MKKTFRSILAGALALLTVSCYDDSAIREDIVKLDERVTAIENTLNAEVNGINDLAERLAAAETALAATNANVASIVTKLDAFDGEVDGLVKNFEAAIKGLSDADKTLDEKIVAAVAKVAVVKVEEVDGNVVLTLADNTKVSLSKPLSNVDNKNLVTVVDGVWAVVKEDGTTESLNVPVGHPDVQMAFQVTADGKLQFSVNGGAWADTGVSTADISGQKYVINDVVVAEDQKSVKVTIGDAEFALPVYVATPSVRIKSGKQFFSYAQSKQVSVALEGVSNLAVMNQPYGWKASIKGTTLTVTAPSEGNADAEKEGTVVLHGDSNGACVTAVLNVVLGSGLELTIDDNGLITVVNPVVVTTTNWFGDVMTGFVDFAIGFVDASIYETFSSNSDFYNAVINDYEGNYGLAVFANNVGLVGQYDEEAHKVDTASISIAELGQCGWPAVEIEKGKRYVVWVMPQESENPDGSEMLLAYYEPINVDLVPTVSFDEISLALELSGAKTAYVGAMSEAELLQAGFPDFKTFMEVGYGYGGPWKQFVETGEFMALGQPVENGSVVSVAELVYGCTPGTKYYVYFVPVREGKAPAEYVYEKDCRVYEFTTANLVEGAEEAELTFNEEKTDYASITVDVAVPAGTIAHCKFYEVGAVSEYTDEQLIADILGSFPTTLEESGTVKESYLSDGQSMMLVVLTVSEDGKYAIVKGTYTTKKYNIVDTITVTPESVVKADDGTYTAVFAVTGATKVAVYSNYSSTYSNFNKYLMQKSTSFKYGDVVDGKATVTGLKVSNESYFLIYSAFNEDANGNVSEFTKSAGAQVSTLLPAAN